VRDEPLPYSFAPVAPASRIIFAALCLMASASPRPAAAQDTTRAMTVDSLLARLRALESSVEVLQKQLTEQATTAVQTRSRIQMDLTGRVVMNAFSNERGVNNVDDPQFVRRDSASL